MALARTTINEVKSLLSILTKPSIKYAEVPGATGLLNSRPTSESHARMTIPIKSNKETMLGYLDSHSNIRIGKLLEDLDMVAGWIAYRHNAGQEHPDGTSPLAIVTACVDSVQIYRPKIPSSEDLFMFGAVSWTGTSSMEISMFVTEDSTCEEINPETTILDAKFVMVARGGQATGSKAQVYPLRLDTAKDEAAFKRGEKNKERRISDSKRDLQSTPPTQNESQKIHDMYLKHLDKSTGSFSRITLHDHANSLLMKNVKLKSCITCSPEHRNVHNKIFGGFLMRKAIELAEANFALYMRDSSPKCIDIADISFKAPVEIGSLLLLNSQIIATRNRMAILRIHAEVVRPELNEQKTTNIFYFVFESDKKILPHIVPESYGESLMAIDGDRRLDGMLERHQGYKTPAGSICEVDLYGSQSWTEEAHFSDALKTPTPSERIKFHNFVK